MMLNKDFSSYVFCSASKNFVKVYMIVIKWWNTETCVNSMMLT